MVEQDQGSWRAPAGRTLLPTTRRSAACAPTSPERAVGRGEEAPCNEVATPDSWYWSASGGSLGGVDADASSVSHQAATVDLQRAWVGDPRQLQRPKKPVTLRGLNDNHNHDLKDIFKGAAMRASTAAGPLHDFYEALLAKGRKPTMARLTLARKIAAITLIVWKKEVRFDANYLKQQAA